MNVQRLILDVDEHSLLPHALELTTAVWHLSAAMPALIIQACDCNAQVVNQEIPVC